MRTVTFHNATEDVIAFDIDRERFEVPPGAECEIPREVAYVVGSRGLRLRPGHSPVKSAPVVEPSVAARIVPPLPPGIEAGHPRHAQVDDIEEESDEDIREDNNGEPSAAVVGALQQLEEQGVQLPGTRPAGRRRSR